MLTWKCGVRCLAPALGMLTAFAVMHERAQAQPVYNWSGLYVGAHTGYGWADQDVLPTEGPFDRDRFSTSRNSFIIGGQLGYNIQSGNIVFGPQARFSWFSGEATATAVDSVFFFGPTDYAFESNFVGSLQGRVGVALGGNGTLLYGQGGFAFSQLTGRATFSDLVGPVSFSDTQTRIGAVLGAGIERAISERIRVGFLVQHYFWSDTTLNLGHNFFGERVRAVVGGGETTARVELNYRLTSGGTLSDARLKRDIVLVGRRDDGLALYRYRYLWSDTEYVGVIAQDVLRVAPDAVAPGADGFLRVNYARLGTRLMTWREWPAAPETAH